MRPGETLSLTFPLPNDRCISKPVENLLKHGENSMVRTPRTTGEPRAGCSKGKTSHPPSPGGYFTRSS